MKSMDNMHVNLQTPGTQEMAPFHDTRLTSSEIASLWTTYMNYSMLTRSLEHFLRHVENQDIQSLLAFVLDVGNKRMAWIKDLFSKENLTVPIGFSDEDVNLEAPRLYSDPFYLYYLLNMTRVDLPLNGLALTSSARADVRDFYLHCCDSTAAMAQKTTDLLLAKGLYVRSPYITLQKTTEMVKSKSFLSGFLGERRPLLASEISGLNYGVRMNNLGKALLLGFRQVTSSKTLQDFLKRGIDLSSKLAGRYSSFLDHESIPTPMSPDTFVTDSTVSPFSERLMINEALLIIGSGLSAKAAILTSTFRSDIYAALVLSMTEIADYLADGIKIAIDNGWFEEPAQLVDREALAHKAH